MSNCVDQATIELIARNVVLRMVMDHTLQAGLRSCETDCSWLGHETRVVTCTQLEGAIDDALGLQVEEFSFDSETNQLTLRTNNSAHTVDLSALEGGRPVAFNVDAEGEISLTTQDGTVLATNLGAYVDAAIDAALNDRLGSDEFRQDIIDLIHAELARDEFQTAVRTMIEAGYASPEFSGAVNALVQAGFLSDEFNTAVDGRIAQAFQSDEFADAVTEVAEDAFANMAAPAAAAPGESEDEALPTTMIGSRTAILGRPDGFMLIAGKRVPFWDDECAGQ